MIIAICVWLASVIAAWGFINGFLHAERIRYPGSHVSCASMREDAIFCGILSVLAPPSIIYILVMMHGDKPFRDGWRL